MPITSRLITSVVLRPRRSPRWPKKIAPIGRATMAAPKTAKEASRAVVGLPVLKNSCGKTSTAAVAYT